jgi:hypothetical protein
MQHPGATRWQLRDNAAEICQAYTVHMGQPDRAALTGYRVAVTSANRADELCALLRRHGATVCSAPAITMVALPDDDELHRHTEALIARPPDIRVATTVDTAVLCLRTALGDKNIVATVVKRGYRLAIDEHPGAA